MLEKLKKKWQETSTRDKVKMFVGIIADAGIAFIANGLSSFGYDEDSGKIRKACVNVGSVGLGLAMSDAAKPCINQLIDSIFDSYELGKAQAAEKEKEHAGK